MDSIYGSSQTGNCEKSSHHNSVLTCKSPADSVLFDGNVTILAMLDGAAWASQILTLHTMDTFNFVEMTFNFADTPSYNGVERVELIGVNCQDRGAILIDRMTASKKHGSDVLVTFSVVRGYSCNSLVSVCITNITSIDARMPIITIEFALSEWVYIDEITFYTAGSGGSCHPEIFGPVTTPTPNPTTDTPTTHMDTTSPEGTSNGMTSTGNNVAINRWR